jgi:hypothetical protein
MILSAANGTCTCMSTTVQADATGHNSAMCNAVAQHSTTAHMQCSTVQYSKARYTIVRHCLHHMLNSADRSTIQYNTV